MNSAERAAWVAVGALAYPGGVLLGHLIFHRSVLYPHQEARRHA